MASTQPNVYTDLSDYQDIVTGPEVIEARLKRKVAYSTIFKRKTARWEGKQLLLPATVRAGMNTTAGRLTDALNLGDKRESSKWDINQTDLRRYTTAFRFHMATQWLSEATGTAFEDEKARMVEEGMSGEVFMLTRAPLLDSNGTLADVAGIYDSGGGAYTDGQSVCYVKLNRGATAVGSLARFYQGEKVAIHAGSASTVRIYARVLDTRANYTLGAAGNGDYVILGYIGADWDGSVTGQLENATTHGTSLQQSSFALASGNRLPNGTLRAAGPTSFITFNGVVSGDYIRTHNGYENGVYGIDAYSAGGTIYGLDTDAVGNDWARFTVMNSGGKSLTPARVYSMLDAAMALDRIDDLPDGVLRVHQSLVRDLRLLSDGSSFGIRPVTGNDVALNKFGWKGEVLAYGGKSFAFLADPMQVPSKMQLLDPGTFRCYTLGAPAWLTSPNGTRWENVKTVSGTEATQSLEYEAHRVYSELCVCTKPRNNIEVSALVPPGYDAD